MPRDDPCAAASLVLRARQVGRVRHILITQMYGASERGWIKELSHRAQR